MKNKGIVFFSLLMLLFCTSAYSQTNREFVYGKGLASYGSDIALCEGKVYTLGYTLENNIDLLLHCHFKDGRKSWTKSIGSASRESGYRIIGTSDSNLVIAGFTTHNSVGGYDFAIMKLDPNGNILWKNQFGGIADDYFSLCVETADGYIFGGSSSSNSSSTDIVLMKTDFEGTMVWMNAYKKDGYETIESMTLATDGSILATGRCDSGMLLMKANASDGQLQWIKNYWAYNSYGSAVYQHPQGSIFVGTNHGELFVLNATGNVISNRQCSTNFNFNTILAKDNSQLVFSGSHNYDAVFGTIDASSGSVDYLTLLGGNQSDSYAKMIKVDDQYHIVGQTESYGFQRGYYDQYNMLYAILNPSNPLLCVQIELTFTNSTPSYTDAVPVFVATPVSYVSTVTSGLTVKERSFYIREICGDVTFNMNYKGQNHEERYSFTEKDDTTKMLAVGRLTDPGVFNTGSGYMRKAALTELDSKGKLNWSKAYETNEAEEYKLVFNKIKKIGEDSYFIMGQMIQNDYPYLVFLKTDGNGNVKMSKKIKDGSTAPCSVVDLLYTVDHEIIMACNFYSRGALIKMDTLGNVQWVRYMENTMHAALALSDGSIAIGYRGGNAHVSLAKINKDGDLLWHKGYVDFVMDEYRFYHQLMENYKHEIVYSFVNQKMNYNGLMMLRHDLNGAFKGTSFSKIDDSEIHTPFFLTQNPDSSYCILSGRLQVTLNKNFGFAGSNQYYGGFRDIQQVNTKADHSKFVLSNETFQSLPTSFQLQHLDSLGYNGCQDNRYTGAGALQYGVFESMDVAPQLAPYTPLPISDLSLITFNPPGYQAKTVCSSCYAFSPATPVVSGPSQTCEGVPAVYTVTNLTGPFTFYWNAPNGWGQSSNNTIEITPTTSGNYSLNVVAKNRCEQPSNMVTIPFQVHAFGADPVLQFRRDSLVVTAYINATYQWYLDHTLLQGAQDTILVPIQNGLYTVEVTKDVTSCVKSAEYTVSSITSVNDLQESSALLLVYPNPSTGTVTISTSAQTGKIIVQDALGRQYFNRLVTDRPMDVFTINDLPKGFLYVCYEGEDGVSQVRKVIVY